MLTSDLLRVRVYKKKVHPRYVSDRDPELLSLAAHLIDTFEAHQGKRRHELETELAEIQGTDTDFLLHRAFGKLLFDRCDFEASAPVDPEELRQQVFAAAAAAYQVEGSVPESVQEAAESVQETAEDEDLAMAPDAAPNPGSAGDEGLARPFVFDRAAVLAQVADQMEVSVEAIEEGLYADLKSEQTLTRFRKVDSSWLLRRYNVALAQGVLFRASEFEIELGPAEASQHRELFRKVKFFRLMHRVAPLPGGGWRLVLDGPVSLFKSSGKYGLQMASFLPTLLHLDAWSLVAKVQWGPKRRPLKFELSAEKGLRSHTKLTGQWQPEELSWLPEQFAGLDTDWQIETGGELTNLGGEGVLVPDFVFHHGPTGIKVVMEILGFWRKGAVESRLALLRRHGPPQMILALSSLLAAGRDDLGDLPGEVYVFRTHPIARKVAKILNRIVESGGSGA